LVALEHVAIDGTKIDAQAAGSSGRTREQLQAESSALQDHIRQLLAEAEAIDQQEDAQFGSDRAGAELPPELVSAQSRKQKLDAALQILQERGDQKINLSDPDARVMRHYGGKKDWSYNAQIAVDSRNQVIVAAQVTTETTDQHQLAPMYQQTLANTGQKPAEISADSGYATNASLLFLQENDVNAYMPDPFFESTPTQAENPFSRDHFSYDASSDIFLCPRGQILKLLRVCRKQGVATRIYRCAACPSCPQQQLCLRRGRYRTLKVSQTEKFRDAMRAKLKSPAGWQTYLKRLATVEPVIGHLKCLLRFRDFLLQGLDKVRGEFQLIVSVHNLRKICLKLRQQPPPGGRLAMNLN
jgi:transposase